jgi:ATPase family associated with various cellular activities (AAA)
VDITEQFRLARRMGTPIIAINSADAESTISKLFTLSGILSEEQAFSKDTPFYKWDSIDGLRPMVTKERKCASELLTKAGIELVLINGDIPSINAVNAVQLMASLPDDELNKSHTGCNAGSIVFMPNSHMYYTEDKEGWRDVRQGIQKLRSLYENSGRTLVLLAPEHKLPADLTNSILLLDEPLPNEYELTAVVDEITAAANITLSETDSTAATFAVRGLTEYKARESLALSFIVRDKAITGIDLKELWRRKEMIINATDGLSFQRNDVSFSDIGGLDTIIKFVERIFDGKQSPQLILFADELEKSMAGGDNDTSGVSQDQIGVMLQSMEDYNWTGLISVGFPGGGKSMLAKAMGHYRNIPTIRIDLGAMMGSLVGESQQRIRAAIKVIHAIAGDRVFVIGTCNDASKLKPELVRRFSFGRWFFDLPSALQRDKIWDIYHKKYELKSQKLPNHDSWTGAEIKVCASLSDRMSIPLIEAAEYIVPFAQSNGELVAALRQQAKGRYLDANKPGFYVPPDDKITNLLSASEAAEFGTSAPRKFKLN